LGDPSRSQDITDTESKDGINDAYSDKWTLTFQPFIEKLEAQAIQAEEGKQYEKASKLYL
jgi:hypothetical protein